MKKFIKILSFLLINLLATMAVDHLLGMFEAKHPGKTGLIFTPHAEAYYETIEFSFTASINALGFRDREFGLSKSADYRILTLGDSFTFGWGVALDQSWPKVLEQNLQAGGFNVEIANLGSPGAGPVAYADLAEKAIPLLKPDLLVVAVLQGDDLTQSRPKQPAAQNVREAPPTLRIQLSEWLHHVYPNLTALARAALKNDRAAKRGPVSPKWRKQAEEILAQFNPEEKKRYERLDGRVREAFISGKLNPPLIYSAIKDSDNFLRTFDLNRPEVQALIEDMSKQLSRIKKAADRYKARVLIVSVPFGIYVSPSSFETWRQYGYLLDKGMLVSDSPDQAIRMASEKAGLPFFAVTAHFRNNSDLNFYFELDGHFNAFGHQFYADRLTSLLMEELKVLSERNNLQEARNRAEPTRIPPVTPNFG